MKDLPPYVVWRIRFAFVLGCIATAALTAVVCAEADVELWRLAMAIIGSVFIGIYCGLWISVEAQANQEGSK